jgi:hypothetical protein
VTKDVSWRRPLTTPSLELSLDRKLCTHFFNPERGANPIMWQHLFGFFGHPEVHIIFVPALGIAGMLAATFARRPIIGTVPMVLSIVAIAGRFPNTPENLIAWIMHPQALDPGNIMPDMGVPEAVARDMAAYLFGLER